MSLVFNDTSTKRGIIQEIESECGFNDGDLSGNTNLLKKYTASVNLALDDFIAMAIRWSGTWQFDDSNHTQYPIIKTNLVSGQRDYPFTTDQESNLILDIYKVTVADTAGIRNEITPIDQQSQNVPGFTDGQNTTGIPTRYDKTANGIFLDPPASYNSTLGLWVYINREGSYFVSTDTTKKPGVPGIFHKYFVLRPAQDYARRNNLKNAKDIQEEVLRMELEIQQYFSQRSRDERVTITTSGRSDYLT